MLVLAAAAIAAVLLTPPIAQDPAYHHFAGDSTLPNVLSNLPFIAVGIYGLWCWRRARWAERSDRWAWLVVCLAAILIGFGSGYYHSAPDNRTLFWDRLPMTLGFMGVFAAVIGERVHSKAGLLLLAPFLFLGMLSVEVWRRGELTGVGDLRFYVLVQFYPMIALPILLLLYPARYTKAWSMWAMVGCYVLAKVLELGDPAIYSWTAHTIGGHPLKHIAAAAALTFPLHALSTRIPIWHQTCDRL